MTPKLKVAVANANANTTPTPAPTIPVFQRAEADHTYGQVVYLADSIQLPIHWIVAD